MMRYECEYSQVIGMTKSTDVPIEPAFDVEELTTTIPRLMTWGVSLHENDASKLFHVNLRIECGTITVHANGVDLNIALRNLQIECKPDGCMIVPGTAFREITQEGKIVEEASAHTNSSARKGAEVAASLNTSLASSGTGSLSAKGHVGQSGEERLKTKVATKPQIKRVEFVGGGWRVGDKYHGDPLSRDGTLDGPYLTGSDGRHLAAFDWLPNRAECTIEFRCLAALSENSLSVSRASRSTIVDRIAEPFRTPPIEVGRTKLREIVAAKLVSKQLFDKGMHSSDGYDPRTNELLLGRTKVRASRPLDSKQSLGRQIKRGAMRGTSRASKQSNT